MGAEQVGCIVAVSANAEVVLRLDEVERIVREEARGRGSFAVESVRRGGYTYITLRPASPGDEASDDRYAKIWTSGVEAFLLDVDGGYKYAEGVYDEAEQPSVVKQLTSLGVHYLLGHYQEVEVVRRRGRPQRCLKITIEEEEFLLEQAQIQRPFYRLMQRLHLAK